MGIRFDSTICPGCGHLVNVGPGFCELCGSGLGEQRVAVMLNREEAAQEKEVQGIAA